MKSTILGMAAMLIVLSSATAWAQQPSATPEHDVLKKDVGVWDAKTKMWMGPGEPEESEGVERNRMLGEFWLVSNFKGKFGGMDFTGFGTMGYDTKSKKYVGTWIDSMTPTASKMVGTFDKASNTFTAMGTGTGPDGNPMKTKNVTVYKDDGSRVMTMYQEMAGSDEMMKTLEIVYTKRKKGEKKE